MLKTEAQVCQKDACEPNCILETDLGNHDPSGCVFRSVTLFLAENPIPRSSGNAQPNQHSGDSMKKMLCKLMLACCLALSVTTFAQSGDSMSQDNVKHDDMKQDQMNKDNSKKSKKAKKAKKDSMKKDDMKKGDGMKHDDMKKDDGMKQDDGMKK
jgi:pentapeptide MXKDX repeat protein